MITLMIIDVVYKITVPVVLVVIACKMK